MKCHNVKEGEVLGSISMVLNIDDIKNNGIETVFFISVMSLFIILFIAFFTYTAFAPYIKIFRNIKNVMKYAENGDYSKRIKNDNNNFDDVSLWVNNLLNKIEKSLKNIESNMKHFMKYNSENEEKNILLNVENKSEELSLIYNFKKTIERDYNVYDIYNRISDVLTTQFKIKDFSIMESDLDKKSTKIVMEMTTESICNKDNFICRAEKTNNMVDATEFVNICSHKCNNNKKAYYLCLPYNINNNLSIILSMQTDSLEEFVRIKQLKPKIENYIEVSKTEIFNKKLLQELQLSTKTDGLTTLYNRKFLEDKIKVIEKEVTRVDISYGILMVDIDYFKEVNDKYGHDIGDKTIVTMAETLLENTIDTDYVIRYGGEEFLVILWNCPKDNVQIVAEKIRERFNRKKNKYQR